MGDFNIPSVTSELFAAHSVRAQDTVGSPRPPRLESPFATRATIKILHEPKHVKSFANHAGVLDFYAGNHEPLYPGKQLTKAEFTYELSDHLALWIQINTDTERERLEQILRGRMLA